MNETMAQEILAANAKDENIGVHPFEESIRNLSWDKNTSPFKTITFQQDLFSESKGQLISTIPQLRTLVNHLKTKSIIGIDLEGYNRDVYRGTTSIIQISTDEENYVVDACAHLMRLGIKTGLKSILEAANIWKVMVGSKSDNLALQRDFGIFLFPVIELQFAIRPFLELKGEPCLVCSNQPEFCKRSKKGLVNQECLETSFDKIFRYFFPNMSLSKLPQKADWCKRPISTDLLRYAVLDSALVLRIWSDILPVFKQLSKPPVIFTSVIVPSNTLLLQLNCFEKEEEDIEKFVKKHFPFGEGNEICRLALQCRKYFAILDNRPISLVIPDDKIIWFVRSFMEGLSKTEVTAELRKSLDSSRCEEFMESVFNKRLPELQKIAEKSTECSRCHEIGHSMLTCTNERVRTDEDRRKDKERFRQKRKEQREAAGVLRH